MVEGFVRDVIDFICSLERGGVRGLGGRGKRAKEDVAKVSSMKHIPLSITYCLLKGGHVMRKARYCVDHAVVRDI